MEDVASRLAALSDQQVLTILEAVSGELATGDTPEGTQQQGEALATVLAAEDQEVDLTAAARAGEASAAAAARELLELLAQVPESAPAVEGWLDDPPVQEAAAIPLLLSVPVVFTGCLILLQMAGHTSFARDSTGKWSVSYDPAKRTPFDGTVKEMVGVLAKLMTAMLPK
jgi:hypothetical protein